MPRCQVGNIRDESIATSIALVCSRIGTNQPGDTKSALPDPLLLSKKKPQTRIHYVHRIMQYLIWRFPYQLDRPRGEDVHVFVTEHWKHLKCLLQDVEKFPGTDSRWKVAHNLPIPINATSLNGPSSTTFSVWSVLFSRIVGRLYRHSQPQSPLYKNVYLPLRSQDLCTTGFQQLEVHLELMLLSHEFLRFWTICSAYW